MRSRWACTDRNPYLIQRSVSGIIGRYILLWGNEPEFHVAYELSANRLEYAEIDRKNIREN